MNTRRALVIGLDGATFDLIDPMIQQGKLPRINEMADLGLRSTLRSTMLPLSPPAWTTFLTGKNPGSHGIYDFAKRTEGSYDISPTTSLDRKSTTIWDVLNDQGGSSIVLNVPLTYPPSRFNGSMITGFPTPTQRADYTHPPALLQELESQFGDLGIHKPKVLYRKGREGEITEEVNAITRRQTEITKFLMRNKPWDLTVTVFDATDVVGHYFWAYLDPKHPKYDPKGAPEVKKMVEEVHVALDVAIGELISEAGQDALKIVMSDHGFGPVYYGVYINNWLLSEQYMNFKKSLRVRAKYLAFKRGFNVYNLLRLGRKLRLVRSIESAYSKNSKALSLLNKISLSFEDVDWEKTRVYSFGNMGQLYLNLKGREPKGVVEAKDVEPLTKELVSKLEGLKDPDTGQVMFDLVRGGGDIYVGQCRESAPDVVFLDQDMVYAAHRMFELGSSRLVTPHPIYSGNHKMSGILVAQGPTVVPGTRFATEPSLVDLAPTLLHYLGFDIPSDMEGSIRVELSGQAKGERTIDRGAGGESTRVSGAARDIARRMFSNEKRREGSRA